MFRTIAFAILASLLVVTAYAQAPAAPAQAGTDSAASAPSPFEVAQDLASRGRLDKAIEKLNALAAVVEERDLLSRLAEPQRTGLTRWLSKRGWRPEVDPKYPAGRVPQEWYVKFIRTAI